MPELVRLPTFLRRDAPISGYNREDNTFEFTISTGARVERVDWWTGERWIERLEISKRAVEMGRLKAGAPIVDSHRLWSVDDVLGTHEDVWVEGDGDDARLKGRGRLSSAKTERLERVRHDVADGILRNTSVGYRVKSWRIKKADAKAGTLEERTAELWEPHENSIVPIGADDGAGIGRSEAERAPAPAWGYYSRGDDGALGFVRDLEPDEIEQLRARGEENGNSGARAPDQRQENPMPPTEIEDDAKRAADQQEAQRKLDEQQRAAQDQARAAERQRVLDIQGSARSLGLDPEHKDVRALIDQGLDVDKAARALIGIKAAGQPTISPAHGARAEVGEEQYGRMLTGAQAALEARMGCSGTKTEEGPAREMRNLSMLEMARELLVEKGQLSRAEARSLSKMQLLKRALHGSSDFPHLTSNAANKRLLQAYEIQPRTFAPLVRFVDAPDFKQIKIAHIGGLSQLEEVGEHGEFHYATVGEKSETYVLATHGKILALTRQLIINDDLRAFADATQKFGRAVSVLENNLHWALRTGNKQMGDGNGIYHSAHGNVGTKVLGVDGLAEGFRIMLTQRDVAPKAGELGDYVNVMPRFLSVPPELMHTALQLTADITPNATSAVNPYRGKLEVIVEPRLSAAGVANGATSWFLDAAPGDWPAFEVAYLEGQRGPVVETREGFEVDGMEFKVRHDVAMAPVDWVGTFRSNGTVA